MHAATDYAERVTSGDIPACKWVAFACGRHLRDLDRDDVYFDEPAADHAIGFIESFKHYKGQWAGEPFHLEPWQKFIVGSIFGWQKPDGLRRFTHAYVAVPRKNGKSILAAGIGVYMLYADGEAGAEVYSAATKIDQARIVWGDANTMIQKSGDPAFCRLFEHRKQPAVIECAETSSTFRPLSREADNLDGLNPHCAIFDELHASKNPDLWNVINSAFGARAEPLFLQITTAGSNTEGVCKDQESHVQDILNRTTDDDAYFGIVYTIDKDDDIADPATWAKANPNFGVSVLTEPFAKAYERAKASPRLLADFKTKRLNVWVAALEAWLDMIRWDDCAEDVTEADLEGCYCYSGLDLAQVTDLSALAHVFPPQGNFKKWQILVRYWCPEETAKERVRVTQVPYLDWVERGLLTATPGDVTDYRFINRAILEDFDRYDLRSLAFDRTFSHAMIQELQDEGVDVVGFGQGFISMSSPSKEFERMVIGGEINHFNHPITRWCAENVVVKTDPAGNIKPDKSDTKTKKIDGIVAAIMGLGVAMADEEMNDGPMPIDFWN
jgi:phage terminase large subunit-like protein